VAGKVMELEKVYHIAKDRIQTQVKKADLKMANLDAKMVRIADLKRRMEELSKEYRFKTEMDYEAKK
jgi:hypothetical protein